MTRDDIVKAIETIFLEDETYNCSDVAPKPVRTGTYEDLAVNIFNSHEFSQAFLDSKYVLDDKVDTIIERVVDAYYIASPLTKLTREKAVTYIRAHIRKLLDDQDRDSEFHSDFLDNILKITYYETHDLCGNLY